MCSIKQQHGLLVINKQRGLTSAQCIKALKPLGQKKIGHAGTLDPMAEGVLLVLLGQGTKLFDYLLAGGKKVYKGTVCFGKITDTWDIEGQVISTHDWSNLTAENVSEGMLSWLGKFMQDVPSYSAAKHNGKPLYKLSREGKNPPCKVKPVEIFNVEVLSIDLPYATFRVTCSSGTYIRSLAHSLGTRMGCGAVLTELTREYSHPFGLDAASDLNEIVNEPALLLKNIVSIPQALPDWTKITVTVEEEKQIRNGMSFYRKDKTDIFGERSLLMLQDGTALALAGHVRHPYGVEVNVLRGLWI